DRSLSEESQITDAVFDSDDDHAVFHELLGGVRSAAPLDESATVDPKHHRQAGTTRLRCKNIQEQAILVAPSCLRALTAELSRFEISSGKGSVRLRRFPAQKSHGRSRVGDAEKFVHAICLFADHYSTCRRSSRRRAKCGWCRAQSDHAESRHSHQQSESKTTVQPLFRLLAAFHH